MISTYPINDSLPTDCEISGWAILFSKRTLLNNGGPFWGYQVAMSNDAREIKFSMDAFTAESSHLRKEMLETIIREAET